VVTIKQVARAAGCSIATVSRVINKQGKYSSVTEERVKKAVERLGYRTNITARRLKKGSTMSVGLVTSEYRLLNHPELLSTAIKFLQSHGFNVEIVLGRTLSQCFSLLCEGRFDGLLITDSTRDERAIKDLIDSGHRFVLLGGETGREDVNLVDIDYFSGGYQATKLLIRNGHSDILLLEGRSLGFVSQEIRRGYLFALDEHGIGYRESLIVTNTEGLYKSQELFGYISLKARLSAGLSQPEKFTAVFSTDDRIAAGVMRAMAECGIVVPTQRSVIGFGNLSISEYLFPPLTSVVVPLAGMAELGAEILVNSITREDSVVKSVNLKPQLVERNTVSKRLT